ncbi:MAG: family hydrolase [Geminicoccaceae bacterium]|jgi:HAD superfamily hydrolase (TIGR01549 family)|nr:family hydrolase [Geminicoccaceae bacterium]
MTSFLDRFSVVLLDLNSTFMFGEDRFGAEYDYFVTYREAGGTSLSASEVRSVIDACYAHLLRLYRDPAFVDDFPTVREAFETIASVRGLPADERARLERVFGTHELGRVPDEYATALQHLARTHRLGLVSNIWSPRSIWLAELSRAGVADLFDVMVFSSDGRSMKPSLRLFETALAAFDVPRAEVVMVGDNYVADVVPAQAAGLAAVWINPASKPVPDGGPPPDHIVPDLLSLVRRDAA